MSAASVNRAKSVYLGKADCRKCLQLLFLECQERSGFMNPARSSQLIVPACLVTCEPATQMCCCSWFSFSTSEFKIKKKTALESRGLCRVRC